MRRVRLLPLVLLLTFVADGQLVAQGSGKEGRTLSFEDRVRAQLAIEAVYYRHQEGASKPFREAVPEGIVEKKVQTFLEQSRTLERLLGRRLTRSDLESELTRIESKTKAPDRLEELYEALHFDHGLILECLVRPVLTGRLTSEISDGHLARLAGSPSAVSSRGVSRDAVGAAASPRHSQPDEPVQALGSCSTVGEAWETISPSSVAQGRGYHTAIWTGNYMVVWGGVDVDISPVAAGARYDPVLDTWAALSSLNEPTARFFHTAVWTGEEMIIWGGTDGSDPLFVRDGGRYNPISDQWRSTVLTGSPVPRYQHGAVWTGSEMLVWGGRSIEFRFNSGGRYDPVRDEWRPMSALNAPEARKRHSAIWTGSEMIIWGGESVTLRTGGRYNPTQDAWVPTSTVSAPAGRVEHTSVWTGKHLIVWGGCDNGNCNGLLFNTGSAYDPGSDSWTPLSSNGAPVGRRAHTAVWTGREMVIWGGWGGAQTDTGGMYVPESDTWAATTTLGAPGPRSAHSAVWTGAEMLIWGGVWNIGTGGIYSLGPAEVLDARWSSDGVTLEWDPDRLTGVRYDVVRGDLLDVGAIGGATSEQCAADEIALPLITDSTTPSPGKGLFFIIRGTNPVGNGSYGCDSLGVQRTTTTCP